MRLKNVTKDLSRGVKITLKVIGVFLNISMNIKKVESVD